MIYILLSSLMNYETLLNHIILLLIDVQYDYKFKRKYDYMYLTEYKLLNKFFS